MTPFAPTPIQGLETLTAHLDSGQILLTVNRRLSGHITRRLNTYKASKNNKTWLTAKILPMQTWLHGQWADLLETFATSTNSPPRLLSPLVEHHLWEGIVADHSHRKKKILWPRQTASLAQKAWGMLTDWHLPPPTTESAGAEDLEAFLQWMTTFEQHLQHNNLFSTKQLLGFIEKHIEHLPLPPGIILAGFDSLPPASAHFFSQLQNRGIPLFNYLPESYDSQPTKHQSTNTEEEIRHAAQWAKQLVEKGIGSSPPNGAIGIIHPALDQWRNSFIRIFSEVFYPGAMDWNCLPDRPIFNLSLGVPLLDSPMVADALFFLKIFNDGCFTPTSASRLLHSPYCHGGRTENSARALLDVQLRQTGLQKISREYLLRMAEKNNKTPMLTRMLTELSHPPQRSHDTFAQATPTEWPRLFSEILSRFGWPGREPPTSTDFQIIETWKELLESLTSLEIIQPHLEYTETLRILTRAANDLLFQPEGGEDAPVQIQGSLEAGGETFAALWVMGLSDDVWPPKPQPNPFLPHEFQRKHGMPRSSSDREYLFAAEITKNLLKAAPIVVVSVPKRDGDMELRQSPFLRDISTIASENPTTNGQDFSSQVFHTQKLEIIPQDHAPPLAGQTPFPCPTGLLKAQSLCPFQAFARFRLQATPLPIPQTGLSPSLRGQITHRALANLFVANFSSREWHTLKEDQKNNTIENACTKALENFPIKLSELVPKGFLQLERERQTSLLHQWLAVENRRKTDFTVLYSEAPRSMRIDRLEINYRVDRIDRLDNEQHVIIDYKTGKPSIGDWFGPRPKDPQIPIYALGLDADLAALAYGQLSRHAKNFIGLAQPDILPDVAWLKKNLKDSELEDFPSLKHHWRGVIDLLAQEFIQGNALVSPQKGVCELCDLEPLCRINDHPRDTQHDAD